MSRTLSLETIAGFKFMLYRVHHTRFKPYWRARIFSHDVVGTVRYPNGKIVNEKNRSSLRQYLAYAYGSEAGGTALREKP